MASRFVAPRTKSSPSSSHTPSLLGADLAVDVGGQDADLLLQADQLDDRVGPGQLDFGHAGGVGPQGLRRFLILGANLFVDFQPVHRDAGGRGHAKTDAVAADAVNRETDTSVDAIIDLRRFMDPLLQLLLSLS